MNKNIEVSFIYDSNPLPIAFRKFGEAFEVKKDSTEKKDFLNLIIKEHFDRIRKMVEKELTERGHIFSNESDFESFCSEKLTRSRKNGTHTCELYFDNEKLPIEWEDKWEYHQDIITGEFFTVKLSQNNR